MEFLVDTHALIWFANNDANLSLLAKAYIEDSSNKPIVSVVSIWEIAIKASIGKLDLGKPLDDFVQNDIKNSIFFILDIVLTHALETYTLPLHHRDPFDRMLVAQALVENIPIVSADSSLDAYGVTRLW